MKYTSRLSLVVSGLLVFSLLMSAQPVKVSSDSISSELFKLGSIAFMQGDLSNAIVHYSTLLEREKKSPSLTKVYWYVLIDNLGMAYGISGKLDNAEEIFKYGVSKDSTYPLFYYSLACTYAEREDMATAIDYLKTAFKYKENMVAGEPFPDPMTDDSFQRFVKNKKFIQAVKEMKQN